MSAKIEVMKQSELNGIKARCEAATPGPWRYYANTIPIGYAKGEDVRADCEPDDRICLDSRPVNAEFIAHAREDIPRLVAEVEKLRAALQKSVDAWSASPGRLIAAMDEAGALLEELK